MSFTGSNGLCDGRRPHPKFYGILERRDTPVPSTGQVQVTLVKLKTIGISYLKANSRLYQDGSLLTAYHRRHTANADE